MSRVEARSTSYIPREVFQEHGTYVTIPVKLLKPTQPLEHFRNKSTSYVTQILNQEGIEFMRENPIHVVLFPNLTCTEAAIDDGHHRARFAPKFGIRAIPSLVIDISTVARMLNRDEQIERARYEYDIDMAINSFAQKLGPEKYREPGRIPPSVRDAQDLIIWLREKQTKPRSDSRNGVQQLFVPNQTYLPNYSYSTCV